LIFWRKHSVLLGASSKILCNTQQSSYFQFIAMFQHNFTEVSSAATNYISQGSAIELSHKIGG